MGQERRRSVRITKPLMVQYLESEDQDKPRWDTTEAKNISAEGLMISVRRPFEVDSIAHFRLKVPLNPFQWLEFDGRVVACEKAVTGIDYDSRGSVYLLRIEITAIAPDAKALIKQYIDWYLRKSGDTYIPGSP